MESPRTRVGAQRIVTARAWPEADALFRSDPRWLGSDDAYSIELEPGRILWLFGDTFVGDGDNPSRSKAEFIHNSIGIQRGSDPANASMAFHWGHDAGRPDAFFPGHDGIWYWPLHGALAGDGLLLFTMLVRSPVGGTGGIDEWRRLGSLGFFDVFGWGAFLISNPAGDPAFWDVRLVAERTHPIVLGASVIVAGDRLLAFGWDADKRVSLARWPLEAAANGNLEGPEWWTGSGFERDGEPAVVIERGATEFTVHRDRQTDLWCQTQMVPSNGDIVVRRADRPQGPWSDESAVFRPEEASRPDAFVYAGKAHPHLTGADLVLTYASIADVDVCLADDSIYYPRFVRVTMERP